MRGMKRSETESSVVQVPEAGANKMMEAVVAFCSEGIAFGVRGG